MLALRFSIGLGLAYGSLLALAWAFQARLAFPAPRAPLPDPARLGLPNGERLELKLGDGTSLAGWFLAPKAKPAASGFPALLWFYGNGENIAAIWPVLVDFQPPGAALLVVDYPGYGASGGRATEAALYEAAETAYAALLARPGVDKERVYVYGRSLGSAVATHTAAGHPVAGVILESPFTSAAAMARHLYALFPHFIVRLSLDNLANIARIRSPVLVFHGDRDRLVPMAMGMAVARAAPGPVEVVLIHGAGHNDTYTLGGKAYRDKVWAFVSSGRERSN
jgi:uncharacterized protein